MATCKKCGYSGRFSHSCQNGRLTQSIEQVSTAGPLPENLQAQVACLEAKLAEVKAQRDGIEQTMQDNADVARNLEAANAAMAAALRDWLLVDGTYFYVLAGRAILDRMRERSRAALSDAGKGWPEVRATALAKVRTIEAMAARLENSSGGYSQQMAGHIRQACFAALDALEVE